MGETVLGELGDPGGSVSGDVHAEEEGGRAQVAGGEGRHELVLGGDQVGIVERYDQDVINVGEEVDGLVG